MDNLRERSPLRCPSILDGEEDWRHCMKVKSRKTLLFINKKHVEYWVEELNPKLGKGWGCRDRKWCHATQMCADES